MKNIVIAQELKDKLPHFRVAVVTANVTVEENNELNSLIEQIEQEIESKYELSDVLKIPFIEDARNAYKTLGKDPSRYRLACESLLRRLVKGNKLYRINNVVDIGNIISIQTKKSVAALDYEKIDGDITIKIGGNEPYEGIGRGLLNVEYIPVYYDDLGPFGSTTSDTLRTSITEQTTKLLLFIISFSENGQLDHDIDLATKLIKDYANATNVTSIII